MKYPKYVYGLGPESDPVILKCLNSRRKWVNKKVKDLGGWKHLWNNGKYHQTISKLREEAISQYPIPEPTRGKKRRSGSGITRHRWKKMKEKNKI